MTEIWVEVSLNVWIRYCGYFNSMKSSNQWTTWSSGLHVFSWILYNSVLLLALIVVHSKFFWFLERSSQIVYLRHTFNLACRCLPLEPSSLVLILLRVISLGTLVFILLCQDVFDFFFWLGYPRMCCLISTYCGFSNFSYIIDSWGHPFRSEKNVQFNFNLVLCVSMQMSILEKALWHVFEKNMYSPDSWWNVLDCILVHVLWVWYWVIDLEVLSPIEITSLKFFAQFPLQIHQCFLHTLDSLVLGAHRAMPSHWIDPFII